MHINVLVQSCYWPNNNCFSANSLRLRSLSFSKFTSSSESFSSTLSPSTCCSWFSSTVCSSFWSLNLFFCFLKFFLSHPICLCLLFFQIHILKFFKHFCFNFCERVFLDHRGRLLVFDFKLRALGVK